MINQISNMQPMAYSMPSSIFPTNYASPGSASSLAMPTQYGPPGLLKASNQSQMAGPLEVLGQMIAMMFGLVEKLVSAIVNLTTGNGNAASTSSGTTTAPSNTTDLQALTGAAQPALSQASSIVQGDGMYDSILSILKKTQEYKNVVGDLFGSFMKSAKGTLGPIIDTVGTIFNFGGGGILGKIAKIF